MLGIFATIVFVFITVLFAIALWQDNQDKENKDKK